MNRTALNLSLPLLLLVAAGCSNKATPTDEHETHRHEQGQPQEEGRIPIRAMRGIRLMKVPEVRVENRWLPGEAQGDEAAQAVLSSPVKGIVSQLVAIPGQGRAAGATLALVQSPELARLKAEWLAARSKLTRTQAELAREERLFQAGAGARRDLEGVRSEVETSRAEEEAARLGLEAIGLKPDEAGASFTVKAPASGALVAWKVQKGQGVEAGQELGRFQAAQASVVTLDMPPPGPSGWTPGSETEVRQSGGKLWKARVEGLATTLSPDTQRLGYRLRFLGGALPIPGTPVEVKVPLSQGSYLPQAALQQLEGRWGVFVVEGDRAEFRPVRPGGAFRDEVLVLEGLKPGETVVAEGAYLLKALTLKRTEPEGGDGHGH